MQVQDSFVNGFFCKFVIDFQGNKSALLKIYSYKYWTYTHTHNLFMSLGVRVSSGVLMHGTASCSSQRTTWKSVFSSSIMQFMGFVVRLGIKCLCPLRNLSHQCQSYIYYWYLSREIYFNFLKMPHTHIVSLGHICPQLLTSNNFRSLNNDV